MSDTTKRTLKMSDKARKASEAKRKKPKQRKLDKKEYTTEGFYERVKAAWEHAGYPNQESFASASDINKGTISKWKDGDSIPHTKKLIDICNICGCDFEYLLGKSKTFKTEYNDTATLTGLNEKAIKKLRATKKKADKKTNLYETVQTIERDLYNADQKADQKTERDLYEAVQKAERVFYDAGYSYNIVSKIEDEKDFSTPPIKEELIPELLSHFITAKEGASPGKTILEEIAESICRQNVYITELYYDPLRNYLIEAYSKASAMAELTSSYQYEFMRNTFYYVLRETLKRNGIDPSKCSLPHEEDILHDDKPMFTASKGDKFELVHNVLDPERSEYMDIANTQKILKMLQSFSKTTNKLKAELFKEKEKHHSK